VSTSRAQAFERGQAEILSARLAEPRRFLQVVAGELQVGKTTLVHDAVLSIAHGAICAHEFAHSVASRL
jgi:hypothetical protein